MCHMTSLAADTRPCVLMVDEVVDDVVDIVVDEVVDDVVDIVVDETDELCSAGVSQD